MTLNNQIALVTGAGTGIGRAIAMRFAREGARVAVNYRRSQKEAEEVVAGIRTAGGTALAIQADVSQQAAATAMIQRIEREWGRLDFLVNNAAWTTPVPHEKLDALTDEIWTRTLDSNLRGPFYCVRAAVPLLRKNPGASIVNITSTAGINGLGSSIAYCASKAGLDCMTKSLARALAPEIRVNAVAPGLVRTNFVGWPDSIWQRGKEATPLERISTTEEVAAAVFYLAAEAGSVTGETIVVDGGVTRLGAKMQLLPRSL
jgi:3-oxoacyl-[acyl-carrier protein] reductase